MLLYLYLKKRFQSKTKLCICPYTMYIYCIFIFYWLYFLSKICRNISGNFCFQFIGNDFVENKNDLCPLSGKVSTKMCTYTFGYYAASNLNLYRGYRSHKSRIREDFVSVCRVLTTDEVIECNFLLDGLMILTNNWILGYWHKL